MSLSKIQARTLLRDRGLRATAPRVAVLRLLDREQRPLSHSEVLTLLGDSDWDQATVYRNLVKLSESGVTRVVSRAGGMARYELASDEGAPTQEHPHFVCSECGTVSCLPLAVAVVQSPEVDGAWQQAVDAARIQLEGRCPDCLAGASP